MIDRIRVSSGVGLENWSPGDRNLTGVQRRVAGICSGTTPQHQETGETLAYPVGAGNCFAF